LRVTADGAMNDGIVFAQVLFRGTLLLASLGALIECARADVKTQKFSIALVPGRESECDFCIAFWIMSENKLCG